MQTRHRIPTIFSLSMVDVLCCALGCVILLWLLNYHDAKRKATAAGQTRLQLDETRSKLDSTLKEAEDYRRRLDAAEQLLKQTLTERDAVHTRLTGLSMELTEARNRAANFGKQVTLLKSEIAAVEDRLQKKTQDFLMLGKDRDAAAKQLADQKQLLLEKEKLLLAATRSADDIAARLRTAEDQARKLADEIPRLRDESKTWRDKAALAETQARTLATALDEQKQLTEKAVSARVAAENRFAGLELTGRRVLFLVDTSGSMDFVDEKTLSPDKWKGVIQTLLKIMRSLPNLEKFQVIAFADKATFPLGSDNRWLGFDARLSTEQVLQALTAIKPKGNTNMYAGFEAAFRYRGDGLDTIYLLSDGLPNIGAGVTAEQYRTLNDFQRTDLLSRHVRTTLKTTWNRPEPGRPRVRINAVGFFYESPDVGAFLWALTRENDGSFVGMNSP
jgi:hypothetical protein